MQCPKCSFEHPDQSTECLRCGIVFEKYVRHQERLDTLSYLAHEGPTPQLLHDTRNEFRYRLLALPLALIITGLLVGSGFHFVIRTFLSMWVHESGHAVTAWLCGFGAFPGPWRTPVSEERVTLVTVCVVAAIGYGIYKAWRGQRIYWVAAGTGILLIQLICTLLPVSQANALIIFGGDAGCFVLGSVLMASFYIDHESPIYRGGLRWGFLAIGAASFMDAFSTWWSARNDIGRIPFGEMEGVGFSDPTRLTDEFGWDLHAMIQRYVWLAGVCLFALAAMYLIGLMRARAAARAMTPYPAGSSFPATEEESLKKMTSEGFSPRVNTDKHG